MRILQRLELILLRKTGGGIILFPRSLIQTKVLQILSLQDGDEEIDLGFEADCGEPKIIHRTSSLNKSIQKQE